MKEELVTIEMQSYPPVEIRPGPPIIVMRGFPPLPGENYIEYGRRVQLALALSISRPR